MTTLNQLDVTTKAAVLLEALPYIQRFRGAIFVVKYGGAFMDNADPEVRTRVATDIAFLHAVGIKVVLVHGGGKAINRALNKANVASHFKHGLRVTDAETVEVVERTLNREVNLEICEILQAKNASPLSILGNNLLVCESKNIEVSGNSINLGFVGNIHTVKTKIIKKALNNGYIPVISPLACDEDGQVYNTNADEAAGKVAASLRARRLVYLCDVPGIMNDINNQNSLISTIKADEVDTYVAKGTINKGMIPKTDSAVKALNNGVNRVHFINGEQPHSLLLEIFTDNGVGTEIVNA